MNTKNTLKLTRIKFQLPPANHIKIASTSPGVSIIKFIANKRWKKYFERNYLTTVSLLTFKSRLLWFCAATGAVGLMFDDETLAPLNITDDASFDAGWTFVFDVLLAFFGLFSLMKTLSSSSLSFATTTFGLLKVALLLFFISHESFCLMFVACFTSTFNVSLLGAFNGALFGAIKLSASFVIVSGFTTSDCLISNGFS